MHNFEITMTWKMRHFGYISSANDLCTKTYVHELAKYSWDLWQERKLLLQVRVRSISISAGSDWAPHISLDKKPYVTHYNST